MNEPDTRPGSPWLPPLVLLLVGAVVHCTALTAPLNVVEVNAGAYFGCALRNFEEHGFLALRGLPLVPQLFSDPAQAEAYVNHPPGVTWIAWLFGGDELGLRLPGALAALGAALGLNALLRRAVGAWPAALAGLAVATNPALAYWLRASYEPPVLVCGVLLWLASQRLDDDATTGAARTAWRLVQVAACVFGAWMDWAFPFFCLGLVAVVAHRDLRRTFLALLPPAIATVTGLALFLAWRGWATAPEHLPDMNPGLSLGGMLETYVLARPPVVDFLTRGGGVLQETVTAPLLWVGLAMLPVLLWRLPRLGIALLCGAWIYPLLFANHALDHPHFWGYTVALLPAGVASIATWRAPTLRVAACILLGLLSAFGAWRTFALRAATTSDVYAAVGRTLTAAAADVGAGGIVVGNFPQSYPFYVRSTRVYPVMIARPEWLEAFRTGSPDPQPLRYLQVRVEGPGVDSGALTYYQPLPALEAYLERFERTEVPALVGKRIVEPMLHAEATVTGAWIVQIVP